MRGSLYSLLPSPILKVILKICTNMVDEKVSDSFLSILLDLLIKLNIFSLHIGQENSVFKKIQLWTSLLAQWLRPCAPSAEGHSSIPGQGTRSSMLQLRPGGVK